MATVNVYLTFNGNCREAFDFYKSVFGGEYPYIGTFGEMPPMEGQETKEEDRDKIMHVSLPISKETILMGSDAGCDHAAHLVMGNNFSISINAESREEADKLFAGLSTGGNVTMPMSDTFWGAYFGMFADQFGINWMAQKSDLGAWYMYFGNNKISKKLNFHNEIQYRNFDGIGDLEQLLIRTGIGYDLTENNNNILLGYGFILSQPYVKGEKTENIEHRIFQQYITKQKFGRFNIQHRYRLEERFLEDDFRMRFRYFLGFNIPINNKEMLPKTFYASAYNEIFLHFDSPVFDRNRVYGTLGYVINKNMRIEAGYMNQIQENRNRGQIQIGFYNNIPFTKN
ncbi:hypothetical protein Lal_00009482 [Lupinus albus]|nr:hypothetical protein Lal_00009482 [Lupinus albus]